jgi:ribosomal 50S subunit-associated protein YjgA (DUF615 family)
MTADEDGMADEYERPNKSLLKREAEDMKRLGDELVRMAPADLAQIRRRRTAAPADRQTAAQA